jgi:hypothetical protein
VELSFYFLVPKVLVGFVKRILIVLVSLAVVLVFVMLRKKWGIADPLRIAIMA